jgi:hypothetical protein
LALSTEYAIHFSSFLPLYCKKKQSAESFFHHGETQVSLLKSNEITEFTAITPITQGSRARPPKQLTYHSAYIAPALTSADTTKAKQITALRLFSDPWETSSNKGLCP